MKKATCQKQKAASALAENRHKRYPCTCPLPKPKTMQGLNKATLIGHLGKDPEFAILESGINLAKCSLATSESYKDKEGKLHTQTEWHSLIFWNGLANYAHKYLKKGNLVYVEGKIRTRSYEDKGQTRRYVTEISVERISHLEKANVRGSGHDDTQRVSNIEEDLNLPF